MPRKKSPVTRPVIGPGTFRLVAQRLNHYATPGPGEYVVLNNFLRQQWLLERASVLRCTCIAYLV
jgi:hypothetical protein